MTSPLPILALIEDILLITRVEDVARKLGFQVVSPDQATFQALVEKDEKFTSYLVNLQPALILVDLASGQVPWREWVQNIKTSESTRGMPVVAYGPHVQSADLKLVKELGADKVYSRGKFKSAMAQILKEWAKIQPS
jgi:CheY-like chemotaxis protein